MRKAGIDKAELARRIGIVPDAVDRLFSIHPRTGLDQIEVALATFGSQIGGDRRNGLICAAAGGALVSRGSMTSVAPRRSTGKVALARHFF